MEEQAYQAFLKRAAKYCARREVSKLDMRQKLLTWGATPQMAEQIIDYLEQNGFIDHSRFAQAFAHDKFYFNNWGRRKIEFALRQKQIESQYIQQALEQIPDEDYLATLKKLAQNKLAQLEANDPKLGIKLFNHLLNKGYEPELIKQVLEQIINDQSIEP